MEEEDDEDDESDDDQDDAEGSDDGDDEGDEDESEDDDKPKGKIDPKDKRIQEVSAEAKKYRLKNRELRTEVAQLKAQVAELSKGKKKAKDDDGDDDEVQPDVETTRKLEAAQRQNEDLAIRLEFLANKKHSWKNPKAALKLLDLSEVEIDEDGDVVGLDEAIDQLAKDEPYLLEQQEEPKQRRRATGQSTKSQRKGNPNRDKLVSKYPALRR
jgi:predicted RNase H-like nuclease (RuvC/YqgF family)